jgi:hypothetical protein
MSSRLDPSWAVVASPSTPNADRCVDIFRRPDETFGFEEFRRDPEDMGSWTPVAYYSERAFATEDDAVAAARVSVPWLGEVLDSSLTLPQRRMPSGSSGAGCGTASTCWGGCSVRSRSAARRI